jgi:hypothetical protein
MELTSCPEGTNHTYRYREDEPMTFKALLATKHSDSMSTSLVELEEEALMSGDVTFAVDYSTVNYKDGMTLTERFPVIQTFLLIPGIDLSGTVQASSHAWPAPLCRFRRHHHYGQNRNLGKSKLRVLSVDDFLRQQSRFATPTRNIPKLRISENKAR